ncbi:MAG TPA: class I SAM-dependent methyltransferase [Blastocatellia bacterium]|nr:class I SAM-dependent methyltransferase [Blastocatellia bacterium]
MTDDRETKTAYTTADRRYAARLATRGSAWWKRWLDVQAPYRWNLRRLQPGFTLDIGCGIGRNLLHLAGDGVGVDHNPHSVEMARARGLQAFTPAEFEASPFNAAGRFDSLLLSHVVEHMTEPEAIRLLESYLHALRAGGQVIQITPQESGYRTDPTHVEFMDFAALNRIACAVKIKPVKQFSFPFPRSFGRLFRYNEFVHVSLKTEG